jgi:predicted AlkP superfamily pyrophosphatase or phosphodiesterase
MFSLHLTLENLKSLVSGLGPTKKVALANIAPDRFAEVPLLRCFYSLGNHSTTFHLIRGNNRLNNGCINRVRWGSLNNLSV